jgi:O-antigen ligase
MGTITVSGDERDQSSEGRLYFWTLARRMAGDHPWTGVGFNAYSRAYDRYDEDNGAYGEARAVHSTWFGMLAENGYPGLIILLAVIVVALRSTKVAARGAALSPDQLEMAAYSKGLQASRMP